MRTGAKIANLAGAHDTWVLCCTTTDANQMKTLTTMIPITLIASSTEVRAQVDIVTPNILSESLRPKYADIHHRMNFPGSVAREDGSSGLISDL